MADRILVFTLKTFEEEVSHVDMEVEELEDGEEVAPDAPPPPPPSASLVQVEVDDGNHLRFYAKKDNSARKLGRHTLTIRAEHCKIRTRGIRRDGEEALQDAKLRCETRP